MESEKVKEIKKGLEFMIKLDLSNKLPYIDGYTPKQIAYEEIFNYINELESENERLIKGLEDLPIPFMGCMLENQLLSNISKKKDGEIKALKDRIAELEKKNEILQGTKDRLTFADRVAIGNKALNQVKSVELPKFAERLKAKMPCEEIFKGIWDKIDETLKEFIDK